MQIDGIRNRNNLFIAQNKPNIYFHKQSFKGAKEDLSKILVSDVFQKQTTTQIPSNIEITLVSKLKQAIPEIILPQNLLGQGFHGSVYMIDNKFALKINNNLKEGSHKVSKSLNVFKGLKKYYGENVVQVDNMEILNNTGSHIPAGVPRNIQFSQMEEYYNTTYLPTFAEIPQKSYDDIAKDFATLNKMKSAENKYYKFDSFNPSNIILKDNELLLVDKIEETNSPNTNSVSKLVELLLYKLDIENKVENYKSNVKDAKKILKKIIIASEKYNLPYTVDFETYTKEILDSVFEKCKSPVTFQEFMNEIISIKYTHFDTKIKEQEIRKYLDKILPSE